LDPVILLSIASHTVKNSKVSHKKSFSGFVTVTKLLFLLHDIACKHFLQYWELSNLKRMLLII
jgi:hypothetical protein